MYLEECGDGLLLDDSSLLNPGTSLVSLWFEVTKVYCQEIKCEGSAELPSGVASGGRDFADLR